jgi:hypothetical protein
MTLPQPSPLRYAVVLTRREALKPAALAQALAPVLKRPAVDLAPAMRRCWGLVELDADEASAREQAAALEAAGFPALAVPANLVEDLPAGEKLTTLSPAGPVALLAAAAFTRRDARVVKVEEGPSTGQRALGLGITLATGLPPSLFGVGGKKEVEKKVESSELYYYADLYAGSPVRRLRVDAQDFDFSLLGERKGFDAPGNFRKVLETLRPGAARLNTGAEGLLAGKPVRELGYETVADLEREARWLLTLGALGK